MWVDPKLLDDLKKKIVGTHLDWSFKIGKNINKQIQLNQEKNEIFNEEKLTWIIAGVAL